jgi:hypothetical protein
MNDVVDVIGWWTRRAATAAELEAFTLHLGCPAGDAEPGSEADPAEVDRS